MAGHEPNIRHLVSDYLLPPLDTALNFAYRVKLAKSRGKPGSFVLTLDPNSCILDDFGQPLGTTLMADFEFEIELEHLGNRHGEALYEIISHQTLPAHFRLIVRHSGQCVARLLTLDHDQQITQIVHLRADAVVGL